MKNGDKVSNSAFKLLPYKYALKIFYQEGDLKNVYALAYYSLNANLYHKTVLVFHFCRFKGGFCEFYVFPISPRPIHMGHKYDYVKKIPNPDFFTISR
jgi:hypothetical protein